MQFRKPALGAKGWQFFNGATERFDLVMGVVSFRHSLTSTMANAGSFDPRVRSILLTVNLSARGRRRFSRSAERRGAGPQ